MIHKASYNPEKISYISKLEYGQWSRGEKCKEKNTQVEAPHHHFRVGNCGPGCDKVTGFNPGTYSHFISLVWHEALHFHLLPKGCSFLVTRACWFLFFLPHCVHVAWLYLVGCPITISYFMSFPKRIIGSFESLFLIHPWQLSLYYSVKHAVVQWKNKEETEEWTTWRCSCRHL